MICGAGLPYDEIRGLLHLRMNVVCHVYEPSSHLCAQLDLHLEGVARSYPGTRFVRAPIGRPGFEAFVERVKIGNRHHGGPCLAAFRYGCLVACCQDMRVFGGGKKGGEIYGDAVDQWLQHSQVLVTTAPTMRLLQQKMGDLHVDDQDIDDDEEEEEEYFECGMEGCRKTFSHHHVGVGELPGAFAAQDKTSSGSKGSGGDGCCDGPQKGGSDS